MKQSVFRSIIVAASALLVAACAKDPVTAVPEISLEMKSSTACSVTFSAEVSGTDSYSYICRPASEAVPEAEAILAEGYSASPSAPITVNGLEPETEYRISATASNKGGAGNVATITVRTSARASISIAAGEATAESLTFTITAEGCDHVAYIIKEGESASPEASEILEKGNAAESGKAVTVNGLKESTSYTVSAAASVGGEMSEVSSIQMTTLSPAHNPSVEIVCGEVTDNSVVFTINATDSEKVSYMFFVKGSRDLPDASKVMEEGSSTRSGEANAMNNIPANTTYVIAAASSYGQEISEVKYSEVTTLDKPLEGPVKFDRQAAALYYGDTHGTGYAEYVVVLADGETAETGGEYTTVNNGRTISLDLYQFAPMYPDKAIDLPARTYRYATTYGMSTLSPDKTFCITKENGKTTRTEFSDGTVEVSKSGLQYTIKINLKTTDGEEFSATYEGHLDFENKASEDSGLPAIGKDLTGLEFIKGLAKYYTNTDEADECVVHLYDVEPKISYGSDYLLGAGHMLAIDLNVAVSDDMVIPEGTYTASESATPGTFTIGYTEKFMDTVLAMGTYCEEGYDDSYDISYGMVNGGTVKVEKSGSGYKFTVDLTTDTGHKITGTFDGEISMTDIR